MEEQERQKRKEFLNSPEFTKQMLEGINNKITEDTWDKGMPKIVGRWVDNKTKFEMYRWYQDGRQEVFAFNQNRQTFILPTPEQPKIEAYWTELYSEGCRVQGATFTECKRKLFAYKEKFKKLHQEYVDKQEDDLDEF